MSKYFDLGGGLRIARLKAGLSLEQLERIIHIKKQTLSQYELNRNEPKLDRVHVIARACGTDYMSLLKSCEKNTDISLIAELEPSRYHKEEE